MSKNNRDIVLDILQRVQNTFPQYKMNLNIEPSNVNLELDIPQQDGLLFNTKLNYQNEDELHLLAGAFWQEWFPCSEQSVSEQFFQTVVGLLNGSYRIVEYYQGKKAVKAKLQRPNGTKWHTIATWSCLHLPLPFAKKVKILRNKPD